MKLRTFFLDLGFQSLNFEATNCNVCAVSNKFGNYLFFFVWKRGVFLRSFTLRSRPLLVLNIWILAGSGRVMCKSFRSCATERESAQVKVCAVCRSLGSCAKHCNHKEFFDSVLFSKIHITCSVRVLASFNDSTFPSMQPFDFWRLSWQKKKKKKKKKKQ